MKTKPIIATLLLFHCSSILAAQDTDLSKLPFDFPLTKLDVENGQYVLCPPKLWIDQANEKGLDKQSFIYYTAKMIESGQTHSTVKTLPGKTETIANALIIPISSGQKVKVGDIVLTWWQSGSGMNRAIVVGGTDSEPLVKYLDIQWDNPTGVAKKNHTLKPQSFHKLTKSWQPGTAVAIKSGAQYQYGQVLAVSQGKVLTKDQFAKIQVNRKDICIPIPIRIDIAVDDKVYVPVFGKMKDATVKSIDHSNGRVHVSYEFGGKDKKAAIAFGDVIKVLPD